MTAYHSQHSLDVLHSNRTEQTQPDEGILPLILLLLLLLLLYCRCPSIARSLSAIEGMVGECE
jgi:hypothetical protein